MVNHGECTVETVARFPAICVQITAIVRLSILSLRFSGLRIESLLEQQELEAPRLRKIMWRGEEGSDWLCSGRACPRLVIDTATVFAYDSPTLGTCD